jgi:hypothetical protein
MLAGGIFRQENALRNVNPLPGKLRFSECLSRARRFCDLSRRLHAPVMQRLIYGGAAMVFDPRAKKP